MKSLKHLPILIVAVISTFLNISCEKETDPAETKFTIPIKLVATESLEKEGSFSIKYGAGDTPPENHVLTFNVITEIELGYDSGSYFFLGEDTVDGKIDLKIESAKMKSFTNENPLILKYGHYKDAVIAEYTMTINSEERVGVYVQLDNFDLYQVDWGDGSQEVVKNRPYGNLNDGLEHFFESDGEYKITVTTTNLERVLSFYTNLGNSKNPNSIKAMQIGNLPNLNTLDIGKNSLINAENISSNFPKLKNLFYGPSLENNFNLSNNPELERLILKGENLTDIKGLESLTKLKFLSLNSAIANLNTNALVDLESLNLLCPNVMNLDLSLNSKLQSMWLQKTPLSSLDLSNNTDLENVILDETALPIYDFTKLNKLESITIRALVNGEIRYPENMDNITNINYSNFSRIESVIDFTGLMLQSQQSNPREKVTIKYPRNRYPSISQQDDLKTLTEDWAWIVEYRNN